MGVNPYSPSTNLACTHLGGHDDPRHLQSFASLFDLNRQIIELVRSDMIAARLVFALNSASTSLMTQVTLTDIRPTN